MPKKAWSVRIKKGYYDKTDGYEEVEVAVTHSSDTHGLRSYGWASPTKVIVETEYDGIGKKELGRLRGIAQAIADHLNAND